MVKIFRSIGTQLDDELYGKLIQICKEQGCTPYYVIKDLLEQYIEIYEWAVKEELEKEKERQEEVEDSNDTGQTESDDSELEQTNNSSNNKVPVIKIVP